MELNIQKGWMPDYLPFNVPEGGLLECKNLLPYDEYYAPVLDKVDYSTNTLAGTPLSGIEFKDSSNNTYVFCGSTTKLYRLETTKALTDISKLATTYTAGTNKWYFIQFGDWVIATNFLDVPQVLKGFSTANFIDLGGTPPRAKYVLLHSGHLILAHLTSGGITYPKKLQWSGKENPETWTQSFVTGADSQDFPDGDGNIAGLATLGSGFGVFHKNSITIGWYSGSPYTFSFAVSKFKNMGAIDGSVVSVGDGAFFWGEKDIFYTNGSFIEAVGTGVRNTILGSINLGYLYRISSLHDVRKGLIYWAYPTTNSTDGRSDRIICYNYRKKVWAHIDTELLCLFNLQKGAVSFDDADFNTTYPSADAIPYSSDSNFWQANSPVLAGINTNSKITMFTGAALTGEVETPEFKGEGQSIIQIKRVRPKIQLAVDTPTVNIASRFNETDSPSYYANAVNVGVNGYADLRKFGRYLKCMVQTGLHSGFSSIELDMTTRGKR